MNNNKIKTFKVGGCVRDTLLGIEPNDIDYVVVGASPEDMLSAGFSRVGSSFPVFLDKEGREFALARTERKIGEGYFGFSFSTEDVPLIDDLKRRDLTINSMAMDSSGAIIDPFGGIHDLNRKILRHTSAAFIEDPLRVLRVARFHARFGKEWTIAPETKELCKKIVLSGELKSLSKERIFNEFEKTLAYDNFRLFITDLIEFGCLNVLFEDINVAVLPIPELEPKDALSKFATICFMNSEKFLQSIISDSKFTNEFKDIAAFFLKYKSNADKFILIHDIFKNKKFICDILRTNSLLVNNEHLKFLNFLSTCNINFESIHPEIRNTLKGKQISDYIFQLKLNEFKTGL